MGLSTEDNIEIGAVITRAWNITWKYKVLWMAMLSL